MKWYRIRQIIKKKLNAYFFEIKLKKQNHRQNQSLFFRRQKSTINWRYFWQVSSYRKTCLNQWINVVFLFNILRLKKHYQRKWRNEKKNRVIIDIRDFNFITKSNAYSLSLQTNIFIFVRKCKFISIIDCVNFFYQWRVHSNDKHKFIVINHRKQIFFNVVVMKYVTISVLIDLSTRDQFYRLCRLVSLFIFIWDSQTF